MVKPLLFSLFCVLGSLVDCYSARIVEIPSMHEDATRQIQEALNMFLDSPDEENILKLSPGEYHLSKGFSSPFLYHVSNTTSFEENPDPVKHIGLWLKGLQNITIDGNGATLITHGEMTPFVIDSCSNICIKNLTLEAADPSVVEIKILERNDHEVIFDITPPSDFEIEDGVFYFKGEGWIFGDGGKKTNLPQYAQVFYPERDVTLRKPYPLQRYINVEKLGDRRVKMEFEESPQIFPDEIYQLRHGIRNEVCGFINYSKDVGLSDINIRFLGNFGIVSQFSDTITLNHIEFAPQKESGRSNAGFADFLQFSGCKGKITIKNSVFTGSQDDPINIHGTHLKVVGKTEAGGLIVQYSHPQTYGFWPATPGDHIEFIDSRSLNTKMAAKVEEIKKIDDYRFEICIDKDSMSNLLKFDLNTLAIENVTYIPEVEISGCYFSRTPTRGILLTTRGNSLIENNTFYRIPMSSILVSDDANSWYESGAVKNLTIRNNIFYECASPVICVKPEISKFEKPVHENITIEGNRFIGAMSNTIYLKASADIYVNDNIFEISSSINMEISDLIIKEDVTNLQIKGNKISSESK